MKACPKNEESKGEEDDRRKDIKAIVSERASSDGETWLGERGTFHTGHVSLEEMSNARLSTNKKRPSTILLV
jgi:hypothetical protein